MSKTNLVLALLGTSVPTLAQAVCDPIAMQTIYSHNPWNATGYGGNGLNASINLIFDLEVKCTSIELNELGAILYDQGAGNPIVPNQVGNFGIVNIYTFPTTHLGNTGGMTGWTHIGAGEVTVNALGSPSTWGNDYSSITNITDPVTNVPVVLATGSYGVAIELLPTNAMGTPVQTGPNAANVGSLHTLANSPNPANLWEDQYVKITNDGFMPGGWQVTGAGVGPFPLTPSPSISPVFASINIVIDYDVAASVGGSIAYGDGCYARHKTAYESFPESLTGPDLVDPSTAIGAAGGMRWVFIGSNYVVTPNVTPYVTPTSTSITTGAYGVSNTTSWAGAISTPYSFPTSWTNGGFEHPAGVATQFGVNSRGYVFLGDVTVASPLTCGAPFGSLTGATANEPSIRPFHTNLDPTLGGGIYVDFDPATPPQWIRISWDQLQEPGIPTSVSTFSLTMHNGGDVEIAYVSLSNQGAANNALVGYFEANNAPISPALDWSALSVSPLPQTGNGDAPPTLSLDACPQLGTTVNFVTDSITTGTLGGVFLVGLNATAPVDLASFGAPGCFGHVDINNGFVGSSFMGLNANNQISVPLVIPNNPAFLSTNFHSQTLTLLPGINALGSQSTNGLCVNIGN